MSTTVTADPWALDEADVAPGPCPTALATRPFTCSAPLVWPDESLGVAGSQSRARGGEACWTDFPTAEARETHIREAHPQWYADTRSLRPIQWGQAPSAPVEEPLPARGNGAPGDPADHGPSDAQLRFIATLAERKGVEAPEVDTKRAASEAIERLQALPDAESIRRNRHAAPCSECGTTVEAGEGALRKDDHTGRWIVGHLSCPTDVAEVEPTEVPDGYYAVEAEAGHLSFYKVTKGRKPGVVFVDLCLGGGANGSLTRQSVPWRNRPAILAKIAVDHEAAGRLFAAEVDRCYACGRGLTNDESRKHGIGPECRRKSG